MGMLSRASNCAMLFVMFFSLITCSQNAQEEKKRKEEVLKISENAIGGKSEYTKIYNQCNDSLSTWCSAGLPGYKSVCLDRTYRLDSTLCFTRERDRMVTAILVHCNRLDCDADAVKDFYGAKIKGQWYFFRGGDNGHHTRTLSKGYSYSSKVCKIA